MTISNEMYNILSGSLQKLDKYLVEDDNCSQKDKLNYIKQIKAKLYELKQRFLIKVYADEIANKNNIIISNNYLNRLQVYIQQIQEFGSTEKKIFQSIGEQCELCIQKLIDKKNQQLFCCDIPMYKEQNSSILSCIECGKQQWLGKRTIKKDQPENQNTANYTAMKHFDACFKNIFISSQDFIEDDILQEIRGFMQRDRKQKVNIYDVRSYLKKVTCTKGPKYNKLDAQIMQILNGEEQLKLSEQEYLFIKDFYLSVITIFYQLNQMRNNTPNCVFFIKKIINVLYEGIDEQKRDKCNKLIFVQKENTIFKISRIWNEICKKININQAKQEFAQLLKQNNLHDSNSLKY